MVTNMRSNSCLDDNYGLEGEARAHLRDRHVILPLSNIRQHKTENVLGNISCGSSHFPI